MTDLISVGSIKKWDPGTIADVFGISKNVADHSMSTSNQLQNLSAFDQWTGLASDEARDSVHRTRQDLDRLGNQVSKIGDAARKAEAEVVQVKDELKALLDTAAHYGFNIDDDNSITPIHPKSDMTPEEKSDYDRKLHALVMGLAALMVDAEITDHNLAVAIETADGKLANKEEHDRVFSWKPSKEELAVGTLNTIESAQTDIICDLWRKAMGENPTGFDAKVRPWIDEIPHLKGVRPASIGVGGLLGITAVFADHKEGDSWPLAIARETTATAAGTGADAVAGRGVAAIMARMAAGTAEGAEIGAEGGSLAEPGGGTLLGAVIGGLVGAGVGIFSSKGIEHAYGPQDGGPVSPGGGGSSW